MQTEIVTTGYQGETIDQFVRKLIESKVDVLVDVRALPLSRKKGFSKTSLAGTLAEHGIDYLPMRALGMPKALRDQRHDLDDNTPILESYEDLLPGLRRQIADLMSAIEGQTACLMCFEADASQCHRSRLSAYLEQTYPSVRAGELAALTSK